MKAGTKFLHRRIQTTEGRPATCEVSAVRGGLIYYRVGDERKAKEFTTPERWEKICLQVTR